MCSGRVQWTVAFLTQRRRAAEPPRSPNPLRCRLFMGGTRFCASAARSNAEHTALERQPPRSPSPLLNAKPSIRQAAAILQPPSQRRGAEPQSRRDPPVPSGVGFLWEGRASARPQPVPMRNILPWSGSRRDPPVPNRQSPIASLHSWTAAPPSAISYQLSAVSPPRCTFLTCVASSCYNKKTNRHWRELYDANSTI
jgi:hypothetical protein